MVDLTQNIRSMMLMKMHTISAQDGGTHVLVVMCRCLLVTVQDVVYDFVSSILIVTERRLSP